MPSIVSARLGLVACLLLISSVARGEQIDAYNAARNDRFATGTFPNGTPPTVNPTFFIQSFDLSGIGWVPGTAGSGTKNVMMISDIHYIAAWHFPLGSGTQVGFKGTDGSYVTRNVASEIQIAGSDVLIGELTSAVPSNISFYPIAVGAESAFLGQNMYMYGQRGRVGRNVVGQFNTIAVSGSTRTAWSDYDPTLDFDGFGFAQPSPPTDEFMVQGGDSGSPSFMILDGQVSLLGHHVAQLMSGPTPVGSADSFLSFYQAQLSAQLAISGRTLGVHPVPEPATILAFSAPAVVWYLRRRAKGNAVNA